MTVEAVMKSVEEFNDGSIRFKLTPHDENDVKGIIHLPFNVGEIRPGSTIEISMEIHPPVQMKIGETG